MMFCDVLLCQSFGSLALAALCQLNTFPSSIDRALELVNMFFISLRVVRPEKKDWFKISVSMFPFYFLPELLVDHINVFAKSECFSCQRFYLSGILICSSKNAT